LDADAEHADANAEHAAAKSVLAQTEAQLAKDLQGKLSFSTTQLPTSVYLTCMGQLGRDVGERAACVKREWSKGVAAAKALGMYTTNVLSVSAGKGVGEHSGFTVFCTAKRRAQLRQESEQG